MTEVVDQACWIRTIFAATNIPSLRPPQVILYDHHKICHHLTHAPLRGDKGVSISINT
jgi:hypothetical protein